MKVTRALPSMCFHLAMVFVLLSCALFAQEGTGLGEDGRIPDGEKLLQYARSPEVQNAWNALSQDEKLAVAGQFLDLVVPEIEQRQATDFVSHSKSRFEPIPLKNGQGMIWIMNDLSFWSGLRPARLSKGYGTIMNRRTTKSTSIISQHTRGL